MLTFKNWIQEAAVPVINPSKVTKLTQGLVDIIQDRLDATAKAKEEEAKKKVPPQTPSAPQTGQVRQTGQAQNFTPQAQKELSDKIQSLFK